MAHFCRVLNLELDCVVLSALACDNTIFVLVIWFFGWRRGASGSFFCLGSLFWNIGALANLWSLGYLGCRWYAILVLYNSLNRLLAIS